MKKNKSNLNYYILQYYSAKKSNKKSEVPFLLFLTFKVSVVLYNIEIAYPRKVRQPEWMAIIALTKVSLGVSLFWHCGKN